VVPEMKVPPVADLAALQFALAVLLADVWNYINVGIF
jgi:hypothetical protein